MGKLLLACLALAGASLLLPSEPSYDPVAWLVWGRELSQLELDTAGGPSWKPLPVAFTTLTAPFGGELPAALWMVVSRAGALLALALAARLAARLGGGGGVAGAVGGAVAALALFLMPDWFQFSAHGSEAPLAVALMLWAIERQLEGRRGHALALGLLACLLRPELVPFLGLYGLWLWRAESRLRPALVGAFVLLPLAWVGPEWIGSGDPLDGGAQARSEPAWSLSLADQPWLRALRRVHNHAGLAVELLAATAVLGAVLAGGAALAAPRGALGQGRAAILVLAGAALAEIVLFVAMTEAGFSGNPRYVLPGLALTCVLAGAGAAALCSAVSLAARPAEPAACARPALPKPAGALVAAAVLAALGTPFLVARAEKLEGEARQVEARMQLHRDLARAVEAAGGRLALTAFGTATANRALHSRLAWELGVPMSVVERMSDHRVVFRSSRELLVGKVYLRGRAHVRQNLARVGSIRVYRRDGITLPHGRRRLEAIGSPFTSRLQGIHTHAVRGRNSGHRVVTR